MLRTRVLTALLLAPLGIAAVLWLPPTGFQILIALLFGAAAREWCQFCGWTAQAPRSTVGLAFALLIYVLEVQVPAEARMALCSLGLLVWLAGAAWLGFADFGREPTAATRALKALFGTLAFIAGAMAIGALTTDGVSRYWLVLLLLIIWGADVGAYFCGRLFGRRKLAPSISPGKTWAGVWGGQAVVVGVCIAAALWLDAPAATAGGLVAMGMITAAVSVVGDLQVSLMKRHVGLKDAGRLFPGHGGVLDRFDSLIAAAPVFALAQRLLGL